LGGYYTAVDRTSQALVIAGNTFTILECGACGVLYQEEIPGEADATQIYSHWLGKNDPLAPSKPPMPLDYYTYMAQEVMQLVAYLQRTVATARRLRFLDYGMGWANWAQMAQAFGVDVYGVELSSPKRAHAESLGIKVVDLADLPGMKFDFICTEQVIEHLNEPREVVLALCACLEGSGILKISVPDGSKAKSVLKSWTWSGALKRKGEIMPVHPLEHLNCFDPRSLRRFAKSCGLKPVSLPLGLMLAYSTDWSTVKLAAKNVLRPVKRFVLQDGCYALFTRG
jgi:SAM-dependent methyltransferase